MSRSVVVIKDGKEYKVLVCYVQRGVGLHSAALANQEAQRIAKQERIKTVHLIDA